MPKRVQIRRTKGYRKPDGVIVVARPSKWGNPFPVDGDWIMWTAVAIGHKGNLAGRRAAAVALHRAWLTATAITLGPLAGQPTGGSLEFSGGSTSTMDEHVRGIASVAAALSGTLRLSPSPIADVHELSGHDLACWCPLDQPCHADILLELANPEAVA